MKAYLIGYDLNKSGQDYTTLIEEIKKYKTWWHHLDSTWIVITESSATNIRNHLKDFIDQNDELLVVKLSSEAAWTGFNNKGSKWLKENLSNVQ